MLGAQVGIIKKNEEFYSRKTFDGPYDSPINPFLNRQKKHTRSVMCKNQKQSLPKANNTIKLNQEGNNMNLRQQKSVKKRTEHQNPASEKQKNSREVLIDEKYPNTLKT